MEPTIASLRNDLRNNIQTLRAELKTSQKFWQDSMRDILRDKDSQIVELDKKAKELEIAVDNLSKENRRLQKSLDENVAVKNLHYAHELSIPLPDCGCPSCNINRKLIARTNSGVKARLLDDGEQNW